MGTVSPTQVVDGGPRVASNINTPVNQLAAVINGGLDNSNIASGAAIDSSKIVITTAGIVVQEVSANFSAFATGTTTIPFDDTIPQNTEGDQYMTLSITPKAITNRLVIEADLWLSNSASTQTVVAALFQDSTANALAAGATFQATATATAKVTLKYEMAAGTISSTTFKIRAGGAGAGTTTFNGNSGARTFGGVTLSNITILEVKD